MGNEVCIMKPINFNDSQDICDVVLSSRIAVVNMEDLDIAMAQRIIDFLSGTIYAIDGKLFNISSYIYICAPNNVDISGDYAEIAEQTGFDVPVLN
jgi:cell division inhibitor SepF